MSVFDCLLSNAVIATGLAALAACVGRITTRPQITHVLWVLVLVKLVTPPVVHLPFSHMLPVAVKSEFAASPANVDVTPPPLQGDGPAGVFTDAERPLSVGSVPRRAAGSTPDGLASATSIGQSDPAQHGAFRWLCLLLAIWIAGCQGRARPHKSVSASPCDQPSLPGPPYLTGRHLRTEGRWPKPGCDPVHRGPGDRDRVRQCRDVSRRAD